MEFLISKLVSTFFFVAPFFILLGVVITLHELGHFAAAKFLGVKVEVFSIGFGKKILKYKYGDTVYCLSLFFLGGYVKLFGDEPGKELSEEEKKYAFLHKSIPAKITIAFAGPLMNFILAAFLFFVLSLSGEPYLSSKVGSVKPFSQAYKDGFRSGDTIEKINEAKVRTWMQVEKFIRKNPNQELQFKVRREKPFNLDETHPVSKGVSFEKESGGAQSVLVDLTSRPSLHETNDVFSLKKKGGYIEGLSAFSRAPYVALIDGGWAKEVGFKNFDNILSINQKKVKYWRDLERIISSELKVKDQLSFEVINRMPEALTSVFVSSKEDPKLKKNAASEKPPLRGEKVKEEQKRFLTFHFKDSLKKSRFLKSFRDGQAFDGKKEFNLSEEEESLLEFLGLKSTELFLIGVNQGSPADKAGLKPGDWVFSVNGQRIEYWDQVDEGIQKYDPKLGVPIRIGVLRSGKEFFYNIIPEKKKVIENRGTYAAQEKKFLIGVSYMGDRVPSSEVIIREKNLFKAMVSGFERTVQYTLSISVSIVKIIQNKISPRNIAGPITIWRVANKTFEIGFGAFLKLMALISINLGLVNLLPIPMLDGGHILFFSIEGLKGTPISLKQMEIVQQVGFAFLILLMGLTFFNDIMNLFRPLF